jgi:hypothetical protein
MTELMAIVFAVLGVGVVLVISGTFRKNRWGINLEPVNCPVVKNRSHEFACRYRCLRHYGVAPHANDAVAR